VSVAHLDWTDMNRAAVQNVLRVPDSNISESRPRQSTLNSQSSGMDKHASKRSSSKHHRLVSQSSMSKPKDRQPLLIVAADSVYDCNLNCHFATAIKTLFEADGRESARAIVCSVERDSETFDHFLNQLTVNGLGHRVTRHKTVPPEQKAPLVQEAEAVFDDLEDSAWLTVADHFETLQMARRGSPPGREEDGTDKGVNDELLIDSTSRELATTRVVVIYPMKNE